MHRVPAACARWALAVAALERASCTGSTQTGRTGQRYTLTPYARQRRRLGLVSPGACAHPMIVLAKKTSNTTSCNRCMQCC